MRRVSCCSTVRCAKRPTLALRSRRRRGCYAFFGAEPRIFDPSDLPFPDQVKGDDHPAVHELRELSIWSEGQIWCSPERHGQISGLMKAQIDHLPLSLGGVRPTQGRTLAVMQVSGGSQSFNAVNTLRLLGRWMRMVTIPNQSSVAKAFTEFEDGRMKPSPYYDRIVDVVEELVRFTVLLRPHVDANDRSIFGAERRRCKIGSPDGSSVDLTPVIILEFRAHHAPIIDEISYAN